MSEKMEGVLHKGLTRRRNELHRPKWVAVFFVKNERIDQVFFVVIYSARIMPEFQ